MCVRDIERRCIGTSTAVATLLDTAMMNREIRTRYWSALRWTIVAGHESFVELSILLHAVCSTSLGWVVWHAASLQTTIFGRTGPPSSVGQKRIKPTPPAVVWLRDASRGEEFDSVRL